VLKAFRVAAAQAMVHAYTGADRYKTVSSQYCSILVSKLLSHSFTECALSIIHFLVVKGQFSLLFQQGMLSLKTLSLLSRVGVWRYQRPAEHHYK
jgi:hypothetical protein